MATPSRSKQPVDLTNSPEVKPKKLRLAAPEEPANRKAPMAEDSPVLAETDEPQVAEAEAEAEGHGDEAEEAPLSWAQRVEAARAAWAAEGSFAPEDLGSPGFNPASAGPHLWRGAGGLPFRLLAAALEEAPKGPRGPRALSNLVRLLLLVSTDKAADLCALLDVLLNRQVSVKLVQRYLVEAMGAAFGWKSEVKAAARSLLPTELADAALAARQRQRTLFQPKPLGIAEVAAAIREHPMLHTPHAKAGSGQLDAMRKLLGRTTAASRETWHLVRVLQNQAGPPPAAVLRALAHAFVFANSGIPLCRDASSSQTLAELMAQAEDAVLRGHAEIDAQDGRLVASLLLNPAPKALVSACCASCGTRVLPMRAAATTSVVEALERLGDGALLAEHCLDGDRVQVHARRAGAEVQVFSADRGDWPERAAEVASVLLDHLQGAADCVLEAVLMKPPKVGRPKAKAAVGEEATGPAKASEVKAGEEAESPTNPTDVDGKAQEDEAEAPWMTSTTVVIFDVLALNGMSLTRIPLRERRAKLLSIVKQDACLKVARSTEIPGGMASTEAVKAELRDALGAYCLATAAEKASVRSDGLVLKRLDGPEAEYFAGRRSHTWQALSTPHATGPEAEAKLFACLSAQERAQICAPDGFHFSVVSARRTNTPEGVRDVLNVEAQFRAAGVQPTWYVDEASLLGYQGLGLNAIVGGKLIPARNLALEDASAMGKVCVQVSDDIARWEYFVGEARQKTMAEANAAGKRAERYQVSPVAAAQFILAKIRGTAEGSPRPQLGGVYPHGNMGHAFKTEEFSYRNFILGDFFVVDKSACRFDTTMSLKEDYDFTCSHLQAHGAVLRCNRLVIQAKHETNSGGACSVRDVAGERERENIRILQRKWPGAIVNHPQRANQVVLRWEQLKLPEEAAPGDTAPTVAA